MPKPKKTVKLQQAVKPRQAVCLSSDFYTEPDAKMLNSMMDQHLVPVLVSLAMGYLGLRIVTDGDVVLMENLGTWVSVRLSKSSSSWKVTLLSISQLSLERGSFPEKSAGGWIPFLRDDYPVELFDSDAKFCHVSERYLARFLFCSTDEKDCAPRTLRFTEGQMDLLNTTRFPVFLWNLTKDLPKPRCKFVKDRRKKSISGLKGPMPC